MKDGGPAFPAVVPGFDNEPVGVRGMSLRDYFAAAAMQGTGLGATGMDQSTIAELCYELADAMLHERAKRPPWEK